MRPWRAHPRPEIAANLTSLIDVTFLLIVFFVLVSKINQVEAVDMSLPDPKDPATHAMDAEHQVVLNILPGEDGRAIGYRVGTVDFAADRAGLAGVTTHLAAIYRTNPRVEVNIRADRATHYEHVEPVLRAVGEAARTASATLAGTARSADGAAGAIPIKPRVNLMVTRGG